MERRNYNYVVPVRLKVSINDDTNTVPVLYLRRIDVDVGSWCHIQDRIDLFYFYILSGNYFYHDSNKSRNNKRRKHLHQLQQLPLDIQGQIITRLPAMSIVRLRSVCRDWYAISYDPSIVIEQLAHAKKVHLTIHHDHHIQEQHVHLIQSDNNRSTVFRLKPLPWSMNIIGSSNGILCFRDSSRGLFNQPIHLYNPLLGGEYLQLPKHPIIDPFEHDYGICFNYGFCFDDVRSKFKVVLFIDDSDYCCFDDEPSLLIYTCTIPMVGEHIGKPQPWKLIKPELYIDDNYFDHDSEDPLILVNSKLHILMSEKMILSFDIASEEIQSMPLNFIHGDNYCNLRIGELRGHLFTLVGISDATVLELWVMKEYGDPESWTKQLVLRDTISMYTIVPYAWNEDDIFLLPHIHQHQMLNYTPSLLSLPSAKPIFP